MEGLLSILVVASVPVVAVLLAVKATNACCKAARQAAYRHAAQIDRAFAKRCTTKLRALHGAAPSVWRRSLRELARERDAREDTWFAIADTPAAAARRAGARARRNRAWRAWFAELERAAAGSGTPPRELIAGNPMRRGAPIRRLCEASVHAPPEPEAVRKQFERARGRGRVEEKIRLGSMLLDAEASVDSSLVRDGDGEIVGRNAGLRGWIFENCPELLAHYGTLMSYRRLAAEFRDAHDIGDPCPAALLLEADAAAESRLPPAQRTALPAARRRARDRLREPEAASAKAFEEKLRRSRGEPRDRRRRLA
jgi:hypothetical protein